MARLLIYYAHPAHGRSRVNRPMAAAAEKVEGTTFVDLYRDYPRHNIDVDAEQRRITEHDVILFQFPFFWYSTPSIIKEWQDLVLEHGFAYGSGGDRLAGKTMMLALTAAGPVEAYAAGGYQQHAIRTFLTPLEQTARLCRMRFIAPYVLFGSLKAPEMDMHGPHISGYVRLIESIRDERYDLERAEIMDVVTAETLPIRVDASNG